MDWTGSKCAEDPALQEWIKDPAHKGEDFFHDKKYQEQAKEYCADCPIRLMCLSVANAALVNEDLTNPHFPKYQGVMGGTTLRQRRAFRKKALKKAAEIQARFAQMPRDRAS